MSSYYGGGGLLGNMGAQPGGGLLGGVFGGLNPQSLSDSFNQHQAALLGLAGGLLSGNTLQQGFGQGLQAYAQGSAYDQQRADEEKARAVEAQSRASVLNYAKANGYSPQMLDVLQNSKEAQKALVASAFRPKDAASYGLTPVYGTDANGNTVMMQVGTDGSVHQADLPKGVSLADGFDKVDRGSYWDLVNKRTGQTVQQLPKDLAGAASQTEQGKVLGQTLAAVPQAIDTLQTSLKTVEDLQKDPNKGYATGIWSLANSVPSTPGYDYAQKVKQAQGQVFLQAYQALKGGGQITEVEGKKAEQAKARLDTAQSQDAFNKALDDYHQALADGIAKLRAYYQSGGAMPAQSAPANAGGYKVLSVEGQ